MTGENAEKAIDQLLAAINQGKDLPRRYQPGVTLGFPDLDVFTPEALDRIKALAGGDPARTARLSAHVLKIAQRECAVPVLPDLVDDAAAQIDLERAEGEGARPDNEPSAPPPDNGPVAPRGLPLAEPSARPEPGPQPPSLQTPGPQAGGIAPGVSAPRRRVRRATLVLGVVLAAAGVAGALAYTGQLGTLGDTRKIVASTLAAIGVAPPGGEQQQGKSGDSGGSSPAGGTAGSELPTGPSGEAAIAEDDRQDETANKTGAAGDPLREDDRSQDDRRAEGVTLAERWLAEQRPELDEAAETAIKQRVREVSEEAEKARQSLEAIGLELEQLHRRLDEEMQARHARELSQAEAEGADAVAQAKDRHQQERAILQRDWDADRESLAAAHHELDQQLQNARHDLGRARAEAAADGESGEPDAISGPHLHEQPSAPAASAIIVAAPPEDGTAADPVATESGLQPQSDQTDDRQQQSAAPMAEAGVESSAESGPEPALDSGLGSGAESGEQPAEIPAETSGIGVVASGQPEPVQDEASEPAVPQTAQLSGNEEEVALDAGQPLPPTGPSPPPAEPAPGAAEPDTAGAAAGTAASDAAEAAPAPEGQPASALPATAAPAGRDVTDLVNRGNALLDFGDLASARLFYRRAADGGSPEGAMRMGMTFDPVYFARTGIRGTQPQIQDALHWYDKAIAMGSRPAERRMEELRAWLERAAAAGDARAKAALQQFR